MSKFCSLFSGSSGNALYLEHRGTKILIDCGVSCKRVCDALKMIDVSPKDIDGIVVTHEHSDHISGIRVFTNKFGSMVFAGEGTLENLACRECTDVKAGTQFEIGNIVAVPFNIPHDAAQPFGYSFLIGDKKISVATDMGRIDANVAESIRGSDLVFIEANHDIKMLTDGPYPFYLKKRINGSNGHLSNDQCATLTAELARTGTSQFILGHLSETNNTPDIARKTVCDSLLEEGFKLGKHLKVDVAQRFLPKKIYEI